MTCRLAGAALVARIAAVAALASAATSFGAVIVTASRDYVDRKVEQVRTNMVDLVDRKLLASTNDVVGSVGSNYVSRVKTTVVAPGITTDFVHTNKTAASGGYGGVRVRLEYGDSSTNVTHYGYESVNVRRGGVDDPYKFDLSDPDGYGIVRKKDLDAIIKIVVTNMMGNVYWKSEDGGKTIDAYYREGDMVSNIVSQVNAYLKIENGTMSVLSAPDNAPETNTNEQPQDGNQ